jgi:hypothetical protein
MRKYAKYWGELKGFALSLHTSGQNFGELGARIDRLVGFGPVVNGSKVTGVDAGGNYFVLAEANADKEMVHMLKLQKLMVDEFGVTAKNNDKLAGIANISEVLGAGDSAEND